MFGLLRDGGPAMWPLLICSICGLAVMIERGLYLYHSRCDRGQMMDEVARSYQSTGLDEALAAAHGYRGPVARVVRQALMMVSAANPAELRASVDRIKAMQQALLERRLYVLATIGAVSPFIGLFGTVIGIQKAFAEIAAQGDAGIGVVGAGVSEALVATAAGLGIAIIAVVAYNIFNNLIDHVVLEMDLAGDEVLSLLDAPRGS